MSRWELRRNDAQVGESWILGFKSGLNLKPMANIIHLTGIFDRILTEEIVEESYKHQIDRLVSENGFTRDAARRMCAIAEHILVLRLDEKAEYLTEIFELSLPFHLASDISKLLKEYYKWLVISTSTILKTTVVLRILYSMTGPTPLCSRSM